MRRNRREEHGGCQRDSDAGHAPSNHGSRYSVSARREAGEHRSPPAALASRRTGPGGTQTEPCLTDAAPEAAPGLPFVDVRYAEARPDAAAIIAAKLQGGSMLEPPFEELHRLFWDQRTAAEQQQNRPPLRVFRQAKPAG